MPLAALDDGLRAGADAFVDPRDTAHALLPSQQLRQRSDATCGSPLTGPPAEGSAGEHGEIIGIVASAKEGDPDAFAFLYARYAPIVFRYVHYRVGRRGLAEDLTSETFLRALRRITSFTWQGKDFGAWLITIARNLIVDYFKSGRSRLEVSTAEMLDVDRAENGPEQAVLDSITKAALLETIRRLEPDQRECVVLRFLHGHSVAETAVAMGRGEGAVKALQYRAVRALARLWPSR